MSRIDNLTGIRGFAALWVVLFHFQSTPVVTGLDLGRVVAHGFWGVDIFFVLSGFILALTYVPAGEFTLRSFRTFVLKRFARIYPLHLATFLLMAGLWEAAARLNYQFNSSVVNDWWTALCNVLMVHAWGLTRQLSWNTPSWSISAEWFAYLCIFPLCVNCLRRTSVAGVLGLAALAWFALIGWVLRYHGGFLEDVATDGILRIIPEFLAGYACYRIVAQRPWFSSGSVAAACGVTTVIACTFLPRAAAGLLLPAIMILMIGLYRGGRPVEALFGNRVMVFLGEISYSIYMVHIFVQLAANQIARRLPIAATASSGLGVLALELLVTIGCGYLGYVWIEVPARRALTHKAGERLPRGQKAALN